MREKTMESRTTTEAFCSVRTCTNSFKKHYWGSIKAQNDGWFLQKNGDIWCPEHLPDWYEEWKAKKALERSE